MYLGSGSAPSRSTERQTFVMKHFRQLLNCCQLHQGIPQQLNRNPKDLAEEKMAGSPTFGGIKPLPQGPSPLGRGSQLHHARIVRLFAVACIPQHNLLSNSHVDICIFIESLVQQVPK